jgi:FkbM family methyltransferase
MDWKFAFRGLKAKYKTQRTEIHALIKGLRRNQIAVDVGANKGSYLWALSKAIPEGRVIAFEPQPVLVQYLQRACAESGLGNVLIEGAGVSEVSGTLSLAIPGDDTSSPGASFEQAVASREPCRFVTVPTVSLDDYFAHETQQIGALKIDVEGHELSVLKGAKALIARHKPTIVCECEARHLTNGSVSDVIEFVESMGYAAYFCEGKKLRPAGEFIPSVHQKQSGERFWDAKDYYNNFVFYPLATSSRKVTQTEQDAAALAL